MALEVDLKSTFMKRKATALQTIYPVTFKTCRAVQKANNLDWIRLWVSSSLLPLFNFLWWSGSVFLSPCSSLFITLCHWSPADTMLQGKVPVMQVNMLRILRLQAFQRLRKKLVMFQELTVTGFKSLPSSQCHSFVALWSLIPVRIWLLRRLSWPRK